MALCQYCDNERVARGYWGNAPVSLCEQHLKMHGHDFDRVIRDEVVGDPSNYATVTISKRSPQSGEDSK